MADSEELRLVILEDPGCRRRRSFGEGKDGFGFGSAVGWAGAGGGSTGSGTGRTASFFSRGVNLGDVGGRTRGMLFVADRFRLPIRGLRGMPDLTSFVFEAFAGVGTGVDEDAGVCAGDDAVDGAAVLELSLAPGLSRLFLSGSVFFCTGFVGGEYSLWLVDISALYTITSGAAATDETAEAGMGGTVGTCSRGAEGVDVTGSEHAEDDAGDAAAAG